MFASRSYGGYGLSRTEAGHALGWEYQVIKLSREGGVAGIGAVNTNPHETRESVWLRKGWACFWAVVAIVVGLGIVAFQIFMLLAFIVLVVATLYVVSMFVELILVEAFRDGLKLSEFIAVLFGPLGVVYTLLSAGRREAAPTTT